MKNELIHKIIGSAIAAVVIAGVLFALFSGKSELHNAIATSPWYMKAIAAVIAFVAGGTAYLFGTGKKTTGNGNLDLIIMNAAIFLGVVFTLLFAANFYNHVY